MDIFYTEHSETDKDKYIFDLKLINQCYTTRVFLQKSKYSLLKQKEGDN